MQIRHGLHIHQASPILRIVVLGILVGMLLLCTQCSETNSPDPRILEIVGVSLSDGIDTDNDGYYSSIRLNFDLNLNRDSDVFSVCVYGREHDPIDSESYDLYLETDNISIDGSTDSDARYIELGGSNEAIPHDNYDVFLRVYLSSNPEVSVAEIDLNNVELLGNIQLETPAEDSLTPLSVTFFNPLFTPIAIELAGQAIQVINVEGSLKYGRPARYS